MKPETLPKWLSIALVLGLFALLYVFGGCVVR